MFRAIRVLLAAVLLVGMSWAVVAQTTPQTTAPTPTEETSTEQTITVEPPAPSDLTTDAGFGVKYTKERVIHLPQDQNKFFVTIIGNPNDPKFQAIKAWFKDVPELARLKSETHFNVVTTTQADYKDRYANWAKNPPAIFVTTAKGGTVFKATGDALPMSGQAMSRAINTEFLRRWRERHLDNRNNNNNNNNNRKDNADDAPLDDEEEDVPDDDGGDLVPDTQPLIVDQLSDGMLLILAGLLGVIAVGGYTFLQHAKANQSIKF